MKFLCFMIVTVAFVTISIAKPNRKILVEVFDVPDSNEKKDLSNDRNDQDDRDDREDREDSQTDQDRSYPIIQVGAQYKKDQDALEDLIYGVADKIDSNFVRENPLTVAEILGRLEKAVPYPSSQTTRLNLEIYGNKDNEDKDNKIVENRDSNNDQLFLSKLISLLIGGHQKEQNRQVNQYKNKKNDKVHAKRIESFYPNKQKQSTIKSQSKDTSSKELLELLSKVLPVLQKGSASMISDSFYDATRHEDIHQDVNLNDDVNRVKSPKVRQQPSRPLENDQIRLQLSLGDEAAERYEKR